MPDAGNRMDVRVRGNAHQLLEKYKTLARDAAQQGDRVSAEYYLQYADHYYRVLNDGRPRHDEQRLRHQRGYEVDDGMAEDGVEDFRAADRVTMTREQPQPRIDEPSPIDAPADDEALVPNVSQGIEAEAETGEGDNPRRRRGRGRPRREASTASDSELATADI